MNDAKVKNLVEKKMERNRVIRKEIMEILKNNGLNFMEARGILSDISIELGRMSERMLVQ